MMRAWDPGQIKDEPHIMEAVPLSAKATEANYQLRSEEHLRCEVTELCLCIQYNINIYIYIYIYLYVCRVYK